MLPDLLTGTKPALITVWYHQHWNQAGPGASAECLSSWKHKLSDKWEEEVYVVVHRAGDLPVYKVKPESSDGPTRTLHRDRLLPCGFLVDSNENSPSPEHSPVRRPRTRQQIQNPDHPDPSTNSPAEDEDSESLVSLNVSPPTLHFIVERQHHYPAASIESENERALIIGPSVETEDQREPPPVEESSSEQSESDMEENLPEPVGNPPIEHGEDQTLPGSEQILTKDSVVSTKDSPKGHNPVGIPENDPDIVDIALRRSGRQRAQPQRLQYITRSNPLISIVQTMLHSLSDALVLLPMLTVPCPFTLFSFNMQRDVHDLRWGGCNPHRKCTYGG